MFNWLSAFILLITEVLTGKPIEIGHQLERQYASDVTTIRGNLAMVVHHKFYNINQGGVQAKSRMPLLVNYRDRETSRVHEVAPC
jgi:hypothetical protein